MNAAALQTEVDGFLSLGAFDALGIAVSGGSDSLALLHLVRASARRPARLNVVSVDHGLRAGAAAECAAVARVCADLGVAHTTLHWTGWDGTGNLQDHARRARYGLIADWAVAQGLAAVALGHTADDQAETFLMRLARVSGADGLAGMTAWRKVGHGAHAVDFVRPLITLRRADLRHYLRDLRVGWIDDPTNDDRAFARVRARRVLAALAPLGIGVDQITDTMFRLSLARHALEVVAVRLARDICRIEAGDVVIDRGPFLDAPYETQLRLLAHALRWVAQAPYRPRLEQVQALQAALSGKATDVQRRDSGEPAPRRTTALGTTAPGKSALGKATRGKATRGNMTLGNMTLGKATLGGCLIEAGEGTLRIGREFAAVSAERCAPDAVWDRRWRAVAPPDTSQIGLEIRALGEAGLRICPYWRDTGLPRSTLSAGPAVWQGDRLVAAPLAGMPDGWRLELACGPDDFFASLLSH